MIYNIIKKEEAESIKLCVNGGQAVKLVPQMSLGCVTITEKKFD